MTTRENDAFDSASRPREFYEDVKRRFAAERELRLSHHPEGRAQFTSDLTGDLAQIRIESPRR